MEKKRCFWAENVPEIYVRYHDEEWGREVHDDHKLFEMLLLESFQAGLSWLTILKKREAFREAFDAFDVAKVAGFTEGKVIYRTQKELPTHTALSDEISADLYKRGMRFVGSVIIYSYLQAVGIVNDHEPDCFLHTSSKACG